MNGERGEAAAFLVAGERELQVVLAVFGHGRHNRLDFRLGDLSRQITAILAVQSSEMQHSEGVLLRVDSVRHRPVYGNLRTVVRADPCVAVVLVDQIEILEFGVPLGQIHAAAQCVNVVGVVDEQLERILIVLPGQQIVEQQRDLRLLGIVIAQQTKRFLAVRVVAGVFRNDGDTDAIVGVHARFVGQHRLSHVRFAAHDFVGLRHVADGHGSGVVCHVRRPLVGPDHDDTALVLDRDRVFAGFGVIGDTLALRRPAFLVPGGLFGHCEHVVHAGQQVCVTVPDRFRRA